ncbi:DUF2934 domain-containing protein [Candidatus Sumerlaeota bacterium]|nr:DUF2934 domain-containing protein [Candidatus Sumerlaeota bacterium]
MATKKSASPPAAKAGKSAGAGEKKPCAASGGATPEGLQEAAYYRWLERGCPQGDDHSDWFEAEKRIRETKKPSGKK